MGNETRKIIYQVTCVCDDAGRVRSEEWRDQNGKLSRIGGPAVTKYNVDHDFKPGVQFFYHDGVEQRFDGGPTTVVYDYDNSTVIETWEQDEYVHRLGAPYREGSEPTVVIRDRNTGSVITDQTSHLNDSSPSFD